MPTTTPAHRKRIGLALTAGLAAAVATCPITMGSGSRLEAAGRERPNILLVLLDDLGYSDLGCYGGEIPTPNIDRLAGNGLRYTQCYNSARCCPSRASLLTGLHPHQAGIGSFAQDRPDPRRGPAYVGHLRNDCVTIAEVLGTTGYRTYMVGKWHVGLPGPTRRGFDEFYGFTRGYEQDQWSPERYERLPEGRDPEVNHDEGDFYATDAFTDYALEFLRQARSGSAPWFLYLAHSAPHFPVQAPARSADRFVATYRRGWDVLRAERFQRMREIGLATGSWKLTGRSIVPVDRPDIANGYPGQPNPAWQSLPEDRREDLARRMAVFAAMVSHVDRGLGRILEDLEANGELEKTLLFLLSDNGACYEWGPFGFDGPSREGVTRLHTGDELRSMGGPGTYHAYGSGWANLGNTPLRLYKHFTHEGGICTPLIVHWPEGLERRDAWVRDPVHVMDILPTICEVTGTRYPSRYGGHEIQPAEGVSLVPSFRGDPLPGRPLAFEHQGARGLRHGRWKVVWSKRMPREIQWELYDLETDRCETEDLAARHPELTRKLADEWLVWARRVRVYPFFETGAPGEAVPTPRIANRPLTIHCVVTPESPGGVILAHGGNRHGYALHLEDGRLVFTVRVNGQIFSTATGEIPSGRLAVKARLDRDAVMVLEVNGERAARGRASGLIPEEPLDELSIGRDTRTAVGDYEAPHPLRGSVEDVRIETE